MPDSGEHVARASETGDDWHPVAMSVALLLSGIVMLDLMGAVAKHLVQHYPVQQVSVARNVFGLLPTLMILLWENRGWRVGASLRLRQWPLALARGLMVAVAQLAFYYSFRRLELATATVLAYCSPILVTLLAIPWLGERIGRWRLAAVVVGFVGVLLVVGPGSDVFTWYAILPVIAAFCYANALVVTRRFDRDASHAAVNLYAQTGAIAGSLLLLLTSAEAIWPQGTAQEILADTGFALLLGVFGGVGVYLLTLAYRRTPASLLAPFEYLGVLSALVIGWLAFREWPVDRIFPGVLFIVGAGLVIIVRQRRTRATPAVRG